MLNIKMPNKSFTLIELLVSITIFSLIIGATAGIFISSLRAQRQALASREALDNLSYTLEYMSRSLRMAKKDLNGICIPNKLNYQETHDGQGIKFLNYNNDCQEFYLDGNRLKEFKKLKESGDEIENYLTSEKLKISHFNINPIGWNQNDNLQPRVTIALDVEAESFKTKIQTTVSQRNLNVQY